MAAIKALIDAQGFQKGDRVMVPADGYGATRALFRREAARGVELLAESLTAERIEQAKPKFVLAETITNPLLSVPDVDALAAACRKVSATFAVDATFASPALHRALDHGADYSVHSTTKWINGHSDAMGGVISGAKKRIEALKSARTLDGNVLGPFEAWLTLRGLRTLLVRMEAVSANAMRIAQRLKASPKIDRVVYPGLPEHKDHAVAKRVLSAFGGMLAFEIKGAGRREAFSFLERVKLVKAAPSLGDVSTLVMHAATASARRLSPEERAAAGIHENLIRVSVGLEDADDVADDLLQALP
jgi:cystathionine beta-lyase/cystathionine gamma-synthase